MQLRIAEHVLPSEQAAARERHFGRSEPELTEVRYSLELEVAEVVAALGDFYDEYAEDDRAHGEQEEDPLCQALRQCGWPAFAELLTQHGPLAERWLRTHAHDLLRSCLQPGTGKRPRFLLNGADAVTIAEKIEVAGPAFDMGEVATALGPVSVRSASGGLEFTVQPKSKILVGRSRGDVLLKAIGIGSEQAWFSHDGDQCWVEDAKSPSGTWVNGQMIRQATKLSVGDLLSLGGIAFEVSF